jgi:GT2 family glycosyltransferase
MIPPSTPTVAAVIPTSNRCERLPGLLEALSGEPLEQVVVVVNGSSDSSMKLLEERARHDPRVRPAELDAPGKAAAQQLGIELANADLVLMLDDDVLPRPGLVAGHARHHAKREGLVVVGYMPVELPNPRRPGDYPLHLYSRSYERVCDEYEDDPTTILQGLWAGNVSMRLEDLRQIGLQPSEGMPAAYWYHQDRDFGLRCASAGLQGVFDRSLAATHLHRASPETYLRVARDSGHTRWAVHALHADVEALRPLEFYRNSVAMPGRLLVQASRRDPIRRIVERGLQLLIGFSGRLRLFKLETHAGFVLGTIEQQRGALEALDSVRLDGPAAE